MVGGTAMVAPAPPLLVRNARHVVADLVRVRTAALASFVSGLDHRNSRMVGVPARRRVRHHRLDERL